MTYRIGFVLAAPEANRQTVVDHARKARLIFERGGAPRMMENRGVDATDGKRSDFREAARARDGETVLFSRIAWSDRATRDTASASMDSDPRMAAMGDLPFDGKRMFRDGFEPVFDSGRKG